MILALLRPVFLQAPSTVKVAPAVPPVRISTVSYYDDALLIAGRPDLLSALGPPRGAPRMPGRQPTSTCVEDLRLLAPAPMAVQVNAPMFTWHP
ncbi:MAG: hypothetical protein H7066_05830 [Cytophagaceae bacterium]|nr:hypothetical protein [Gemmatimonadaceae bacterium]